MDEIVALARAAWDRKHEQDSAEHQAVIAALRRRLDTLSDEERGCAANYLIRAVVDGAAHHGAYVKSRFITYQNGDAVDVVDESIFVEELGWIQKLTAPERLSPALDTWLADKRRIFTDTLRRDPSVTANVRRWPSMSLVERRDFLIDVARARTRFLSDDQFAFQEPAIDIEAIEGPLALASNSENKITIGTALLQQSDPYLALETLYHEGTHNLFTQLATAAYDGRLERTHPLARNAIQLSFTRHFGLSPPSVLESLYIADDEERLARWEGEHFALNLRQGHGLRARFRNAIAITEAAGTESSQGIVRAFLRGLRFG